MDKRPKEPEPGKEYLGVRTGPDGKDRYYLTTIGADGGIVETPMKEGWRPATAPGKELRIIEVTEDIHQVDPKAPGGLALDDSGKPRVIGTRHMRIAIDEKTGKEEWQWSIETRGAEAPGPGGEGAPGEGAAGGPEQTAPGEGTPEPVLGGMVDGYITKFEDALLGPDLGQEASFGGGRANQRGEPTVKDVAELRRQVEYHTDTMRMEIERGLENGTYNARDAAMQIVRFYDEMRKHDYPYGPLRPPTFKGQDTPDKGMIREWGRFLWGEAYLKAARSNDTARLIEFKEAMVEVLRHYGWKV